MRNFIICMLGWWIGLAVTGVASALVMVEIIGMDNDSPVYGLTGLALILIGGSVGVRMTRRFRKPPGVAIR